MRNTILFFLINCNIPYLGTEDIEKHDSFLASRKRSTDEEDISDTSIGQSRLHEGIPDAIVRMKPRSRDLTFDRDVTNSWNGTYFGYDDFYEREIFAKVNSEAAESYRRYSTNIYSSESALQRIFEKYTAGKVDSYEKEELQVNALFLVDEYFAMLQELLDAFYPHGGALSDEEKSEILEAFIAWAEPDSNNKQNKTIRFSVFSNWVKTVIDKAVKTNLCNEMVPKDISKDSDDQQVVVYDGVGGPSSDNSSSSDDLYDWAISSGSSSDWALLEFDKWDSKSESSDGKTCQ